MGNISIIQMSEIEIETLLRNIVKDELRIFKQIQDDERYLSGNEVCKLFTPTISRQTLYNYSKSGRLTAYRIGNRIYFKKSEVSNAVKEIKKYQR